jgi:hypothetical protein
MAREAMERRMEAASVETVPPPCSAAAVPRSSLLSLLALSSSAQPLLAHVPGAWAWAPSLTGHPWFLS